MSESKTLVVFDLDNVLPLRAWAAAFRNAAVGLNSAARGGAARAVAVFVGNVATWSRVADRRRLGRLLAHLDSELFLGSPNPSSPVSSRTTLGPFEVEMVMVPCAPQAVDVAILGRVLSQASHADYAGSFAEVILVSNDICLRESVGRRFQPSPVERDALSIWRCGDEPHIRLAEPGPPRLSDEPIASGAARILGAPIAWISTSDEAWLASDASVDTPRLSPRDVAKAARRVPAVVTQLGLTSTSLRGAWRFSKDLAVIGACGEDDGLELYRNPSSSSSKRSWRKAAKASPEGARVDISPGGAGPATMRCRDHGETFTVRVRSPMSVLHFALDRAEIPVTLDLPAYGHPSVLARARMDVEDELMMTHLAARMTQEESASETAEATVGETAVLSMGRETADQAVTVQFRPRGSKVIALVDPEDQRTGGAWWYCFGGKPEGELKIPMSCPSMAVTAWMVAKRTRAARVGVGFMSAAVRSAEDAVDVTFPEVGPGNGAVRGRAGEFDVCVLLPREGGVGAGEVRRCVTTQGLLASELQRFSTRVSGCHLVSEWLPLLPFLIPEDCVRPSQAAPSPRR